MRLFSLLFLLISCTRVYAQIDIPELDRLLKYGEVESLDVTFRQIPHADEFIDKFNLSNQEQVMIGYWTENYTVKLEQTGSGVRILGINIYPNRIMGVTLDHIGTGRRMRSLFFFLWKIESNNLLVKPVLILNRGNDRSIFNVESVVNIGSQDYYSIGYIADFDKAYVLREQLDFSTINGVLKDVDFKLGKDSLRYRLLYEHAMPNIYEKIGADENLRKFLLNPVYTDPDYYRELERSHSRSYKTEYEESQK